MSRFLQKLELQGFKSFHHKTTIDFLEGITVVVGPNGCGKSNVLDGIRWVLGETSAKALRGGKMGDVLFRGSSGHKASGLAQVTLTCDNSASVLKSEMQEVQIGRRLFANGDSQYLQNKVTCRMRDIHDLFLDTGLGADGYSIIEQGRIGELVGARPEQRREIFEEAAGISRYKVRREETMRKLVRTEEDLLRLFDHISEIDKNCRSLYRQAKKAERFRRLVRRLRRIQKRSLLLRHQALTVQRQAAEARQATSRLAFEAASAALAAAEAAQADAARRHEAFVRELQALQQKRYERQSALDRERHRIEMLEQKCAAAEARIAELSREAESAAAREGILGQTLGALEADAEASAADLGSQEGILRDEMQNLETLRRQLDQRGRELGILRSEMMTLQTKRNVLENERRVAQALIEKLESEHAAHEAHTKQLAGEAAAAEVEATEHRATVERLLGELAAVNAERKTLQDEIGAGDRARDELAQKVDAITRELQHTASRLTALQELEDNFEGYFRGVKEVMVAAQREELRGIVGVVSNLIEVPGNLDVAIEVALGGDLQDIVTRNVESAKAAIQFLKTHNYGRATFLPLDFLHTDFPNHGIDNVLKRSGVIGLARNLVKYDKEIETAARYLFGNTIVVESLDIAIGLERDGMRQRYVSLAGDIVNPRGVLSGGSHKTRGLLSRARELAELRTKKAELEQRAATMQADLRAAKDRSGVLYARAAELQAKQHELQMAEARAERDAQAAETRRRERRNTFAVAEARLLQQQQDARKHAETVARSTEGLDEITKLHAEAEAKLTGADAASIEERRRVDELSERVATLRGETSMLRERASAYASKLQELKAERARARDDQGLRQQQRDALKSEVERFQLEREECEGQVSRLAREREELEAGAARLTTENEELTRATARGMNEVQGLLRDRNQCDNTLRECDVQVTELRVQMESVERECEDEFALTIADIAEELSGANEDEVASVAPLSGEAEDDGEVEELSRDEKNDEDITDPTELRRLVTALRQKVERFGPVNEAAINDYTETRTRLDFLTAQRDDLVAAKESLRATIAEIDNTTKQLFTEAYETIRTNFIDVFRRLFNGGKADLILIESEDQPEPGIDIFAQPPGKNIGGSITLMSGGEKALTALALMMAMFLYKPAPICILDEVDAPLDDVNVGRFCAVIKEFSAKTQFLIITHNKVTMSLADTIYGVTMQEPGVSKLVSVKFDRIEESGLLEPSAS